VTCAAYFAAGVDGISNRESASPAHCSCVRRNFFFSINPQLKLSDAQSDTSRAHGSLPGSINFRNVEEFRLPIGCRLGRGWRSPTTHRACRASVIRYARAYVFGGEAQFVSERSFQTREFVVKSRRAFRSCWHGGRHVLRPF